MDFHLEKYLYCSFFVDIYIVVVLDIKELYSWIIHMYIELACS